MGRQTYLGGAAASSKATNSNGSESAEDLHRKKIIGEREGEKDDVDEPMVIFETEVLKQRIIKCWGELANTEQSPMPTSRKFREKL